MESWKKRGIDEQGLTQPGDVDGIGTVSARSPGAHRAKLRWRGLLTIEAITGERDSWDARVAQKIVM